MASNKIGIIFIALGILLLIVVISTRKSYPRKEDAIDWNFKGVVQKAWHDGKDIPYIQINNRIYYLDEVIWDDNVKIHKGDTVIKKKGDPRIKLIRQNSRDTIYFDNDSVVPEVDWHFDGTVSNVLYDQKGFFFIIVNGREFSFDGMFWGSKITIKKGDHVIKRIGELRLKVIEPNSKDTLYIKKHNFQ